MTSSSAVAGAHALIFQIEISGLPITARSIWTIIEPAICQHETSLKIMIFASKREINFKALESQEKLFNVRFIFNSSILALVLIKVLIIKFR